MIVILTGVTIALVRTASLWWHRYGACLAFWAMFAFAVLLSGLTIVLARGYI